MKTTIQMIVVAIGLAVLSVRAQDLPPVAGANDSFAFNLLGQIAKAQPDKNIFISPYSVSAALQMVANGAAGETKSEMLSVLQTVAIPTNELNTAYKKLNDSLTAPRDATLTLANSIWYQKEIPLKPEFVGVNKNYFGAELAGVDFNNADSARTINDWADKHTSGKIKDIVQFPFPPQTRVILANAIYFKGKWQTAFKKELTQPQDFYFPNGDSKKVPMMQQKGSFNYADTADFQAVQLNYKGRLMMVLYLPKAQSNFQKVIAGFSDKDAWWKSIESDFDNCDGTVVMPKFKVNYDVSLNWPLQAMGIKRAFESGAADFSAMSTEQLFISEVKQKSFIAVDEEGTEAAAVTTVGFARAIIEKPRKTFKLVFDRPFLFLIADNNTGTILFTGIVNDPAE